MRDLSTLSIYNYQTGQSAAYLVDVEDYEFMQQRMEILEGVARGDQASKNGDVFSNQEAKEKMAEIIWTAPALNDLDDIADYIALSNFVAAKKLTQKIFDKITRLENHLESGNVPLELKKFNYKEVVVKPCRIFYKVENNHVYVLHIIRQERDLRKYILQS